MNLNRSIFSFLFFNCFLFFSSYSEGIREEKHVYGFFNEEGTRFIKMLIIGETIGIEKASTIEIDIKKDNSLLEVDTRPDTVTVKVLNNPGIRVGQKLYLIEKHPDHDAFKDGNIIGEIKVLSIYKTTFFGLQLRGEGHMRLIDGKIMTVAMPITSENLVQSTIAEKQGDYFVAKGDSASAIKSYKKALKLDSNSPEAHHALAKLHETKGEGYISAAYEYGLAWKSKDKFADEMEKLDFMNHYARFLINKFKKESAGRFSDISTIQTSLNVSNEAYLKYPNHPEVNFNLAEANFILYMDYKTRKEDNPANRKIIEQLEDKIQASLDRALQAKPQDYKLQALAVYYYYELLKDISLESTISAINESKRLRGKIAKHSREYKTFKPQNAKFDKNVKQAIFFSESLR